MITTAAPEIEVLMVADWAEAIDGKLYVMGGGFTGMVVHDIDSPYRFAVAAILTVPAGHVGKLPLTAHLEDGDGQRLDGWQLVEELDLTTDMDHPGSAAVAGPVEVRCGVGREIVVRMRFASAERSVAFRTRPAATRPTAP